MHSATKYLSGHADVLAGVVVGSRERIDALRPILVDVGGALAPLAAFLVLRGLPTLALRMERHSETAMDLAAWLEGQDQVDRVYYPGLPGDPGHELATRQLDVFGGMFAFELSGGREAGRAFLDAMRVSERTASLGAFRTITTHPPSTTHRQLDAAALRASGIAPGLLRCSVGLEDVEDLREDFELWRCAAGPARGPAAAEASIAGSSTGTGARDTSAAARARRRPGSRARRPRRAPRPGPG